MAVARIGEVKARAGSEKALHTLLSNLVKEIASLPGCVSCELLRNTSDSSRMLLIERWESVEAHREAVANIPKDAIEDFMRMVDGPVSGDYFEESVKA